MNRYKSFLAPCCSPRSLLSSPRRLRVDRDDRQEASTTSRRRRRHRSRCRRTSRRRQYDDRYSVTTASGLAARGATQPAATDRAAGRRRRCAHRARGQRALAGRQGDARAGLEHRAQVLDRHRLRARDRAAGPSASWRPTGRRTAPTFRRISIRKYDRQVRRRVLLDVQARQVPHADRARHRARHRRDLHLAAAGWSRCRRRRSTTSAPAGFAWALMPPEPRPRGRDAGAADGALRHARARRRCRDVAWPRRAAAAPERAQLEKGRDGVTSSSSTTASTARGAASASRSTASGSPSSIAIARRASITSATPIPTPRCAQGRKEGWLAKLMFWKRQGQNKPEQYRITSRRPTPRSVVSVQDPDGAPDKSVERREDPRAAQDQLK